MKASIEKPHLNLKGYSDLLPETSTLEKGKCRNSCLLGVFAETLGTVVLGRSNSAIILPSAPRFGNVVGLIFVGGLGA